MSKFIIKLLALLLALIAGFLIYLLIVAPLVFMGARHVAPWYVMFAFASGIGAGSWFYKRVCSWLLKKKDVENVIESSEIEDTINLNNSEEIIQSDNIKL